MTKTTLFRRVHVRGVLVAATLLLMAIAGRSVFGAASASILLVKEVSVDGGQTYAAYPDLNNPVQAHVGVPVKFRLVITNTGDEPLYPYTVDDCINFNPLAAPFACAPLDAGGQGAPGLVLYEPPIAWPFVAGSDPLRPEHGRFLGKSNCPTSRSTRRCSRRARGQVVRNDAEADAVDGFNNRWGSTPLPTSGVRRGLTVTKSPKMGTFVQGSQVVSRSLSATRPAPATNAHLHDQLPGNGGLSWQTDASQGSCSISGTNVLIATSAPSRRRIGDGQRVEHKTTPFEACQCKRDRWRWPPPMAASRPGFRQHELPPPPLPVRPARSPSACRNGNLNIVFDRSRHRTTTATASTRSAGRTGTRSATSRAATTRASNWSTERRRETVVQHRLHLREHHRAVGYVARAVRRRWQVVVGTLTPADIAYTTSLARNEQPTFLACSTRRTCSSSARSTCW